MHVHSFFFVAIGSIEQIFFMHDVRLDFYLHRKRLLHNYLRLASGVIPTHLGLASGVIPNHLRLASAVMPGVPGILPAFVHN